MSEIIAERRTGSVDSRRAWSAIVGALALAAWYPIYISLLPAATWLTDSVLGLYPASALGAAVAFFLYEVPKVLMLLVVVVFGVGVVRTFFTPERTRALLSGRGQIAGNVLAAGLGVVTPFCSCSAIPLFLGFVESGVPLGVTFSFLIAAPMVNEVALVMLAGMLGIEVALIYVGTGLTIAVTAGWVIGRLGMERHVEPWVYEVSVGSSVGVERLSGRERLDAGARAVREIVRKVWPYVVLGIAVGAGIHGYVPEDAMASIMGGDAWWSVPAAVVVGIPMYSNAAGIVPVVQALLEKGASLGTTLAFMMAVIGLSLPETIILRKVLRPRLIATFIGIMAAGIILVGYLFNLIL